MDPARTGTRTGPGKCSYEGNLVSAKVRQPWPLPASDFGAENLHVPVQTNVKVRLDDRGDVESFVKAEPEADYVQEALHTARVARVHNQIAMAPGERRESQFVTDPQGRKVLKRKRFSAR